MAVKKWFIEFGFSQNDLHYIFSKFFDGVFLHVCTLKITGFSCKMGWLGVLKRQGFEQKDPPKNPSYAIFPTFLWLDFSFILSLSFV